MKVLHSGSLNVKAGGPALSTILTIKGLQQNGVEVDAVCQPIREGDRIIDDTFRPVFSNPSRYGTLAYVPGLGKLLKGLGGYDLYHIQGIWMLHGYEVAKRARKTGSPYVVTLRGMLYPQALAHNALVKKLSMSLYQRKVLKGAAAVQCTCREEMEYYRQLGFTNPVAIIPNPIDTCEIVAGDVPARPVFRVGYLGRVHPRKRIERLIYAFANLRDRLPADSELVIIGGGDDNYEQFLRSEVARCGLGNVRFAGFLSGREKYDMVSSLSLLAVPSDFENFGNIVTEALACAVPVIASKGMPWQELPANGCGWWIDNSQEEIDRTLLEASRLGEERLREMGLKGRDFVEKNYSVEALGRKMTALYRWILTGGEKPEFVHTV